MIETVTKAVFIVVLVILFVAILLTLPTFFLWNWLMPLIFKLPTITLWQAFGITLLSNILFKSSSSSNKN